MQTMICAKCSAENEAFSRFCSLCGVELGLTKSSKPNENTSNRRYDVDSIRVSALGLLILYHIVVGFQPWGIKIAFIINRQSLEPLWILMMVMNIWRIPILFVVSGMGARFAMERRDWAQLLSDRIFRIVVPLVFGTFFIVPIYWVIYNNYYGKPQFYFPNPGHLWFLANIFFYVLILLFVFNYFKKHPENKFYRFIKSAIKKPLAIIPVFALPIMIEAILIRPKDYESFAFSVHGLLLGLVCFFCGFVFVSCKEDFWNAVKKAKFITLILAFSLYLLRAYSVIIIDPEFIPSRLLVNLLTGFESANWMLAAFGFGAAFLNKQSKLLNYLSTAVYPVYIVHLPVQFFFSSLVFPLSIPAILKLVIVLISTYCGSFLIFEIIKRIKWIRFLFGMKIKSVLHESQIDS